MTFAAPCRRLLAAAVVLATLASPALAAKPASGTAVNGGQALSTSLTAAWGMLENTGTTSADGTGNGHTLANVGSNGTAWGTSGSDVAITFNAASVTNAVLAVASPITLSGTSSWSIAFRGHQTSSGTAGMVLGDNTVTTDFVWWQGGTSLKFRDNTSTDYPFTNLTTFTADADYLLVYDQPAARLHLYKDGAEVTGSPLTVTTNAAQLTINTLGNAYTSNTFALTGSLVYAYVWSGRALSSSDAATLHTDPYTPYRSSGATTATLTGPASGVVNAASTNFSVAVDGAYTGTVTPATGGAGTFIPASLTWSGTSDTKTFTYTPTTTAGSPHAVSITASPVLTYSGSPINYTVTSGAITITAPVANQFKWRGSGGSASFTVSGTYTGSPTSIQWSSDGSTWNTLVASPSAGIYSASVSVPTGQYTISVRFSNTTTVAASVSPVSVAYVLAVAGQSNASGRGTNNQIVYDASGLSLTHGLKTATGYAALADPYAVTVDGAASGSWVPSMVGALSAALRAPIGIVPAAQGGTSITQWLSGQADYTAMKSAVQAVGGCDAVLWWQGETDAVNAMGQATYHTDLSSFVASVFSDLSCPVIACRLQTFTGATGANQAAINAAISQGAGGAAGSAGGDVAHLYAGPILTAIPSTTSGPNDTSDTFHLKSDAKLCQAGGMWADAVYKALFQPTVGSGGVPRIGSPAIGGP